MLADPKTQAPVLCEVKFCTDGNAFSALVQLLATAAPLLGPTQRSRLRLWASRPDFVVAKSPRVDLLVLLVDPPQRTLDQDLIAAATTLARTLLGAPDVKALVGRLDVAVTTWSAIAPAS